MELDENPLHPITIDDYPKLFDYVLTADGLAFFHDLRQKYLQGRYLTLDEYNKLRLMHVYYATANRNVQEVLSWQKMCAVLDAQGMIEKNAWKSREDLIAKLLIIKNPRYESGMYRKHIEYIKHNFKI